MLFIQLTVITRETVHSLKHGFCLFPELNSFRRKRSVFCTLLFADFFISLSVLHINMTDFIIFKKLLVGILKRANKTSFFSFIFKCHLHIKKRFQTRTRRKIPETFQNKFFCFIKTKTLEQIQNHGITRGKSAFQRVCTA